jgi:hypothetical protein
VEVEEGGAILCAASVAEGDDVEAEGALAEAALLGGLEVGPELEEGTGAEEIAAGGVEGEPVVGLEAGEEGLGLAAGVGGRRARLNSAHGADGIGGGSVCIRLIDNHINLRCNG